MHPSRRTFFALTLAFGVGLLWPGILRAQNEGQKQNSCIVESTSKSGSVVYYNSCDYKIHLWWALGTRRYDNYIPAGESHDTYNNGPFSFYACAMGYVAVDEYDKPISHQVSNWTCKKI